MMTMIVMTTRVLMMATMTDDAGDGVREGKDTQRSRAQQKSRHFRRAGYATALPGEKVQTFHRQGQVTVAFIYITWRKSTNVPSPRPGNCCFYLHHLEKKCKRSIAKAR